MISINDCLKINIPIEDNHALLCHTLQCNKAFLYTHPEHCLTAEQTEQWQILSDRRLNGEPIAYILGYRDFWTLRLNVTPDVLIPRHETELLVETALSQLPPHKTLAVADLGTGSGAMACALASERPDWQIIATDQSPAALAVAKDNAKQHQLSNITFKQGSWCNALPKDQTFDAIISNPPYIAENEPELKQGDVRFEPQSALIAPDHGLADISTIAAQAKQHLKPNGLLLLEHGYRQAAAIKDLLSKLGYQNIQCLTDLAGLDRITITTFG